MAGSRCMAGSGCLAGFGCMVGWGCCGAGAGCGAGSGCMEGEGGGAVSTSADMVAMKAVSCLRSEPSSRQACSFLCRSVPLASAMSCSTMGLIDSVALRPGWLSAMMGSGSGLIDCAGTAVESPADEDDVVCELLEVVEGSSIISSLLSAPNSWRLLSPLSVSLLLSERDLRRASLDPGPRSASRGGLTTCCCSFISSSSISANISCRRACSSLLNACLLGPGPGSLSAVVGILCCCFCGTSRSRPERRISASLLPFGTLMTSSCLALGFLPPIARNVAVGIAEDILPFEFF